MNQPLVMWLRSVFVLAWGISSLNSGKTLSIMSATRASETPRTVDISGTRSSPSTVPFL